MMRRRDVIAGLLVAAATGRTHAQQTGKVYHIAIVDPSIQVADLSEGAGLPLFRAFFEELRRLGYVEGHNLLVERYSGEGRAEHYPELARDVVRRHPDVIFTESNNLVLDFKAESATIPIVGIMGDPVGSGIVASLARPGGNITGVTIDAGPEVFAKPLELLREMNSRTSRVGVLAYRNSMEGPWERVVREAARKLGISIIEPSLDAPFQEAEYRRTFAAMALESADAVIVSAHLENWTNRRLIVELAEKGHLPAFYPWREVVEIGGLMAYAFDLAGLGRGAADAIDQILKGVKAGEIPISQPTKFVLSINVKTAKTLGLTVPTSLLARADEVIE